MVSVENFVKSAKFSWIKKVSKKQSALDGHIVNNGYKVVKP